MSDISVARATSEMNLTMQKYDMKIAIIYFAITYTIRYYFVFLFLRLDYVNVILFQVLPFECGNYFSLYFIMSLKDPDGIRTVFNVMCRANSEFNVCHVNAGSIPSKYTIVYQIFHTSEVDVLMVSKTWLNYSKSLQSVRLPGLFRNDRVDRVGSGVCMSIYVYQN